MNNLKNLLTKPLQLQQIPKVIPIVILALALIGFGIATYLTVKHYQGIIPPCSIAGCDTVLTSSYAEVYGVPVSLLGSLYYFIVALLLFVYFDVTNPKIKDFCLKATCAFSAVGFVVSLAFISLMLFVLNAICIYCMFSDIITIIIFIMSAHVIYLGLIKNNN